MPWIDLTQLEPPRRHEEALRLALRQQQRPFDLARDSLLRTTLVVLGPRMHTLLVTLHHIVTDGWSMAVLFRELLVLYEAFVQGDASPLEELPIQYVDFALWQRHWSERIRESQLAYWKEQLADAPAVLELPTDRPRPAVQTYRGDTIPVFLPAELTAAHREFGRRGAATLFVALLAAFKLLLRSFTGQDDVVVGCPVANRSRQEIEGLIGFFVNTLVLRTDLAALHRRGEVSLRTLLHHLREVNAGANAHQDLPFEMLVDELDVERSLSHTPLFQVSFAFLQEPGRGLAVRELDVRQQAAPYPVAQFDLALSLVESEHTVQGTLIYNVDLFDKTTVRRLARTFHRILACTAADPERPISDLPILPSAERHQLLLEWNAPPAPADATAQLHGLFEAQVASTPENPALVFEGQELTYRELNERANQLAHDLRARGVGPESRVGIAIERSIELVVGLLAVLKAGGAYVPIDPSYPRQRLSFTLRDAGLELLLTQQHLLHELPKGSLPWVCLDSQWPEMARHERGNPRTLSHAETSAYVIYTSGSTGRPKGAVNTHRAIVNRLLWMQEAYRLDASDRVLQKTPFSFDVSVWEFFWPLATGACLVIAKPGGHQDSRYLVDLIGSEGITTLHFVPSMLQVFLDEPDLGPCASLRRVICSGEALGAELERRFFDRLGAELHNLYGPTEAAVDVTSWACAPDSTRTSVPIGRPITGLRIPVLDPRQQPVPIGVAGELHIGGLGLARGYFRRPGLTARSFVPDPFVKSPGERLYRTGDLVRHLSDGAVEFLGRLDHQVKIRGFRIELGEIEAALGRHPEIRETVTLAREVAGHLRLVAYLVPERPDAPPSTRDLRGFLAERLPEYMVPSTFVFLEAFVLLPNGKLDRRALPEPEGERPETGEAIVAPRTPAEQTLVEIWQPLLGFEGSATRRGIGVHDNFFELGGDSILGLQMISRAAQAGLRLLPRHVFQHQTIAELAAVASTAEPAPDEHLASDEPDVPLVELDAASLERLAVDEREIEDVYPLSPLQEGILFHSVYSREARVYDVQFGWRLRGQLDTGAFWRAWQLAVDRHPSLRTSFHWQELERPLQVVHRRADLRLREEDLRRLPWREQEKVLAARRRDEVVRGFDLATVPLMRLALLRLDDDTHEIVWTHHHLPIDGWSQQTLFHEVFAAYAAFAAGHEPELEAVRSFRDYVAWLARQDPEEAARFWRPKLSDWSVATPLVDDRPSVGDGEEFDADGRTLYLSESATTALAAMARREHLTLNSVTQAAWALLLGRYSGEGEVLFGATVAGRPAELPGVESMIGLFINTLPVRVALPENQDLSSWLGELQADQAEARQYEHLSLAELKGMSDVAKDQPLFESLVVFENHPVDTAVREAASGRSGGFQVAGVHTVGRTNYPLTLVVIPGPRLLFRINYDSGRFDAARIVRTLGHLKTLLAAMTEDASRPLSALPLLTAAERHTLLVEPLETTPDNAVELLHTALEDQAARTPERCALSFEDQTVSYQDLDRHAGRGARRLRRLGVGPEAVHPETVVGVCSTRRVELVVGLLSALKAGGAFLPLDPGTPKGRLAYMLGDAGCRVLLAERRLADAGLFEGFGGRLVAVDDLRDTEAANETTTSGARPESPAYVIYTSGSTGMPKGVVIPHRAIVSRLSGVAFRELGEQTVSLHKASLGFDVAVGEIFNSLLTGGRLVLARPDGEQDPDYLTGLVIREKVNYFGFSPQLLDVLLAHEGTSQWGHVYHVVVGGETVPPGLVARFHARLDGPARQPLRTHRNHHLHHLPELSPRGRRPPATADRPAPARCAGPRGRPAAAPRPPRGARRALFRRRVPGARLPAPPGPDRREARGRPLRLRAAPPSRRGTPLPHRRPGLLAPGRGTRVPGTHRPPGQGPRFPDRARRDRSRPPASSRGARGRGGGP